MGLRGRFKYICEDCKAENWLSAKDRNSRFKPHCIKCGSTWLEPSRGSRGPDKLVQIHDAVRENTEIRNKKMGKKIK